MSGERCETWFNGRTRSVVTVVAVAAAAVAFVWRSQAAQDEVIQENKTRGAVTEERLRGIDEKLDDIRAILRARMGKEQ